MVNAWVNHVKDFAKKNKLSYACAITNDECKASYKRRNEPVETRTIRILKKAVLPRPYTEFQKMFDKASYNKYWSGEISNDSQINKYNKQGADRYALYLRTIG